MSDIPIVSVVMPAYNAERYIEEAIRSVQAQTMENWELIVVDDHSADGTAALIQTFADQESRIRPIFSRINRGAAGSRNLALDMCRGQYVAFLDADDIWRPQKLEKQLEKASATGADIIYCSYALFDASGKKCHADFVVEEQTTLEKMLVRSVMSCSTVLLSVSTIRTKRFPTNLYHEDYAFWLDLLRSGFTAVGVTEVLAGYRVISGSRSFNKLKSAKNRWRVYRDYLGLPLIPSMKAMACYTFNGLKKYR